MPLNTIDKVTKFFNWFIDFLAKPLGIATWSIVLILLGGYYGEYKETKQNQINQVQIDANGTRIKQLEAKIDTLSNRLVNRDCSSEVEKYMNLIQTLQIQTSQNKVEIQKRLNLQKQTTKELEKLDKSLNTN